jgi:WD40 repeat protein
MKTRTHHAVCAALLTAYLTFAAFAFAVEPAGSCAVAPVKTDSKNNNAFTPEQEVYLGDVLADIGRMSSMVMEDETVTSHLNDIGKRLLKQLPPTNLDFRFYVADAPYANAFSIAGGRVYVTRKLIAFARNEDELAAVVAHELGHIVTHQQAIMFTRLFKGELGVTEFKDRKDIEDKFNRLLESKKTMSVNPEDEQEEADRVGLEILVRAGYRAEAMPEFFDRFTANKGKSGNWFTDTFGSTGTTSKRFREMVKEAGNLPNQCIEHLDPGSQQVFKSWQAKVVAYDRENRPESLPGLLTKKPIEPLQDQLHTLRFSPDGKYVIAQDNGMIHVLTRTPFAVKFSIPAREAYPAHFTQDSKFITFYSPDLRVEVWDVETGTPSAAYDVHSAYGCLQTALSRDAKTLACLDNENELVLIDTASQDRIFEKKKIRDADVGAGWGINSFHYSYEIDYVNLSFSPDSKYLVESGKYGTVAVNVAERKEVPLNGNLKSLTKIAFTFLEDGNVFGLADAAGYKASIVNFPQGNVTQTVEFAGAIPSAVTKGDYVLMRPIKDYDVGVLDLKSGQIVRANKKPAMDIWGDLAVSEMGNGEVAIFGNSSTPIAHTGLPRPRLAGVEAIAVSGDFRWLAVSEEERGAVWNLSSGQRLYNVKSFHGAFVEGDGAYVDFPKQEKMERSIARLGISQPGISLAAKVGTGRFRQHGPYIFAWRREDSDKPEKETDPGIERFNRYRYEGENLKYHDYFVPYESNQILEVRDAHNGNTLWTRTFSKDVPRLFVNEDAGVAALSWHLYQSGAKAEFDKVSGLAKHSDRDYMIEVIDLHNGDIVGGLVFDTSDGMYGLKDILATRSWIAVHDSYGRTLAYDLKTHSCTGKIFGEPYKIAADGPELMIRYDSRHFSLYEAATMAKEKDYVFSDPVEALRFSSSGDKFFALTSAQTAYVVAASANADKGSAVGKSTGQ